MKKTMAVLAVVAVSGMAHASLINWGGNFKQGAGGGVYEYTDGDGDTGGQFTSAFTAYLINSSTFNPLIQDGMSLVDLSAVTGSALASSPIFIKDAGIGQQTAITLTPSVSVPDGTDVYTVLVNADSSWAMIVDVTPANVGAFDPAVGYVPTLGVDTSESLIAMGTQDWVQVVPEPATIGLMGVAGLGMFLARKKARR